MSVRLASAEALDVYRHLFALEIGREADEGYDNIGPALRRATASSRRAPAWGLPLQPDTSASAWAVMSEFDSQFMSLAGIEVNRERAGLALAALFRRHRAPTCIDKRAVDVAA